MQKYEYNSFGKIIQLKKFSFTYPNTLYIQTRGIPQINTNCTSNVSKIRELIKETEFNNLLIFDYSILKNESQLIILFRWLKCNNKNVYLVTSNKDKLWFADEYL